MHDAPPRRHELEIPRFDRPRVSCKVFVVHSPLEQVCYGFLAAVGVVREPGAWGDGEVVEHEERGEVAQLGGTDGAAHAGPSALGLLDGEECLTDGTGNRHVCRFDGGEEGWWSETNAEECGIQCGRGGCLVAMHGDNGERNQRGEVDGERRIVVESNGYNRDDERKKGELHGYGADGETLSVFFNRLEGSLSTEDCTFPLF